MVKIDKDKLRDLPGWEGAPVPICMFGDYRALTFCCKPGYSLTFGFKCMRDKTLEDLGISGEEFIEIKEEFSKENDWDTDLVCFGSFSYCCMRRGGCPRRDPALMLRYPDKPMEEIMEIYFKKKKELAKFILEKILEKNSEKSEKVREYLESLF